MADLSTSTVKRRVLFVDSDLSFGRSLERDFRTRSFEIETAGTPDEALARVASGAPDMVVLDLYLPDNAALKLLRFWKNRTPSLVVILVAGHASLTAVVEALKEGARRFFHKPVGAAALLDELEPSPGGQQLYPPPERQFGHQFGTSATEHRLGTHSLKAEGVDRFFAISPGLLSIAGFDGYFKQLNPAWEEALGYTVDELCSRPYLDLVHPDDREKATDEALEIRGGHAVFRFKNRYRCKDQSYRWLAWSATPAPESRLIYASARDVTQSVRMEQGLRSSNGRLKQMVKRREIMLRESSLKNDTLSQLGRFKDEAAATIVHDLKSPLSVIVSNYDFILEGVEGSPERLEALEDSRNAGQRMLRLLGNLVDVATLEEGTLEVCTAAVALPHLVQSVAEQRRVMARARGIDIVVGPCPEITAQVDNDLITRVLENVFDNGMRHTPKGGRIEIEGRQLGSEVEIRIGNSGEAIPVDVREAVFDKYQQTGSGIVGHMNIGLGLYFCRLAIEAHGGRIWVEETADLPTVFVIRLPQRRGANASVASVDRSRPTPATIGR